MDDDLKISVIIPVYNVEEYLQECINSIINQTYKNLEIIIVNDGSTDNSLNICNEYQKIDERIKVFTQKNGGLSAARNTGIINATGDYILFVDSDDWLELSAVEIMTNLLKEKMADIVITGFNNYSKKKKTPKFYEESEKYKVFASVLYNRGINHSACAKLYKKKLWDVFKFPEGKYYEDYYVIYDVIDRAESVWVYPIGTYNYRYRETSITKSDKNALKKGLDYYTASSNVESKLINKYGSSIEAPLCERVLMDRLNIMRIVRNADDGDVLFQRCIKDIKSVGLCKLLFSRISPKVKIKCLLIKIRSK